MSCYEWEAGTIKLPSKDFPKVLAAVQAAQRRQDDWMFDKSQEFWKSLPAKAKRNVEVYRDLVSQFVDLPSTQAPDGPARDDLWHLLAYTVLHETVETVVMIPHHVKGVRVEDRPFTRKEIVDRKPRRVIRKDIDFATSATLQFDLGESYIKFDRADRTVHWSVGENNHARDRGRDSKVAQALFQALGRVTWTRGSGGQIVGNDEYNRDNTDAGGGGNYVIESFPPPKRTAPSYAERVSVWR